MRDIDEIKAKYKELVDKLSSMSMSKYADMEALLEDKAKVRLQIKVLRWVISDGQTSLS